ncbi:MAG: carbamate kinase, partial [Nitrososphaerales archaeon]
CVAETQGLLGSMIQLSLLNHFNKLGKRIRVVSLISNVRVSPKDPAFKNPTKPIGSSYTKDQLDTIIELNSALTIKEIAPNEYRRVVPSPDPESIFEADAIKDLVKLGYVVVAAGGGGIPIISGRNTRFVDAVIDKDLASERLATGINASKFVSLTDVDGVYMDYRSKNRKLMRRIRAIEIRKLLKKGEFEKGSMEPKVKAAIRFVENTGNEAIIANLTGIKDALRGKSGTIVYK